MRSVAVAIALLIASPAAAENRPFTTVGPWDVVMPDVSPSSCIASRAYQNTIFSFALAPDSTGGWAVWLAFLSSRSDLKKGEPTRAIFDFGGIQRVQLDGSSDGEGMVYFWANPTKDLLSAIETAAYMRVTTKTATVQFPLDGISAAMDAVNECWTEKMQREAPET